MVGLPQFTQLLGVVNMLMVDIIGHTMFFGQWPRIYHNDCSHIVEILDTRTVYCQTIVKSHTYTVLGTLEFKNNTNITENAENSNGVCACNSTSEQWSS